MLYLILITGLFSTKERAIDMVKGSKPHWKIPFPEPTHLKCSPKNSTYLQEENSKENNDDNS